MGKTNNTQGKISDCTCTYRQLKERGFKDKEIKGHHEKCAAIKYIKYPQLKEILKQRAAIETPFDPSFPTQMLFNKEVGDNFFRVFHTYTEDIKELDKAVRKQIGKKFWFQDDYTLSRFYK